MLALLDTGQDLAACAAEIGCEVGQLLTPLTRYRLRDPSRPWAIAMWPGYEMESAPRDGTHILAFLYQAPVDESYRGFGEWREIFWEPYRGPLGQMPWHAGDPFDSHSGREAPEHFGEAVPIAWLPLPATPSDAKFK